MSQIPVLCIYNVSILILAYRQEIYYGMLMIKGLLLDYGGVIKPFERPDCPRYDTLGRILGIDSVSLALNPHVSDIWHSYITCEMHPDEFAQSLGARTNIDLSPTQHHTIASIKNHQPFPDMTELLGRLRKQGIELGVISNIGQHLAQQSRDRGDYDLVDFAVLSAEHGTRKPDIRLYHHAYSQFNAQYPPDEVLYVDDTARHLTPAQELGFHTLHIASDMYPVAPYIERILNNESQR